MTEIGTVISASATNTQAEDTVQNPVIDNDAPETKIIHVTLRYRGVDFNANTLYDGLNSAFGTVASVNNSVSRGCFVFDISA